MGVLHNIFNSGIKFIRESRGELFNGYAVVIGVVAIIAVGVVVVVDPLAKWRKWQDLQRIESLHAVQEGLENYYDDFGRYPDSSHNYMIVDPKTKRGIEWGGSWSPYLPTLPEDPEGDKWFVYYSSSESGNQTYGLYASFYYPFEDGVTCAASGDSCDRLPDGALCGQGHPCNSGVSSPNSSP